MLANGLVDFLMEVLFHITVGIVQAFSDFN